MNSKKRNLSLIPFFLAALFAVIAVGGSVTFARFYGEYEKKKEAGVAVVVAKLETNSVYRTDSEGMRISVAFDPTSESTAVKDVLFYDYGRRRKKGKRSVHESDARHKSKARNDNTGRKRHPDVLFCRMDELYGCRRRPGGRKS